MELFLGPVKLILSSDKTILFKLLASKEYTKAVITPKHHFNCHYITVDNIEIPSDKDEYFTGKSDDILLMPYNWYVKMQEDNISIYIEFLDDAYIENTLAIIKPKEKTILISLQAKNKNLVLSDPLFQPLGSLLMVYLAYLSEGFLIHASGVVADNKGMIFTAVSGTGKSTMAQLWKNKGHTIINDDRLWLHKINEKWYMFNTPMVWYAQKPAMAEVNKIFLIRQATINEINKISGIQASMKVMSNCIQHFANQEMTTKHLDRVLDFTSKIPIYDCGFKPDNEIVELINEQ